mgnify:CR=1 FL=1
MRSALLYFYPLFFLILILVSCGKEEQSCQDGVFAPGDEEQTDCGGVCPPCDVADNSNDELEVVVATINGIPMSFSNYALTKNPDWILNMRNDSIDVYLNFGDGDSLGVRDLKDTLSSATLNSVGHNSITDATVLLSEIDYTENRLSGFVECKFVSNVSTNDTLRLINGTFENIPW